MTNSHLLHIDGVHLQNFRCFAECAIELNPQLTVLVAENGRGKTAILDSIGVALGLFVDAIAGTREVHGLHREDVRLARDAHGAMAPVLPTQISAEGYWSEQRFRWARALRTFGARGRTTTTDAQGLRAAAQLVRINIERGESSVETHPTVLPFVGFYGTGRLWSEHRLTEGKRTKVIAASGRMSGYTDCLSSSSSFKGMVAWYENKMEEARDPRFATELSSNLPLLTAVQKATRVVLAPSGWCELGWDFERKTLVVEHSEYGQLPLSALSDGVRNMIALVADVARRCASLNPHFGEDAPTLTPGILLIDEVDMHLHPRWQQLVVELLQTAFPGLQMILSTHSPHVLSTVDRQSIRIVRLQDGVGMVDTPTMQTRGVESADVLASIMSVDPIPQIPEALKLSHYRSMIEDGLAQMPEALALRSILIEHFGEDHPLMLDCERLVRFQAFKVRQNRAESD